VGTEFLGVGLNFPLQVDEDEGGNSNGKLKLARYEESIRQSIGIILRTARGERVMRPDFGCGLQDLIFSVNTPATAGQIASEVHRALLLWETRIDVLDVRVSSGEDGQVLFIDIKYQVRATNNVFNRVFPFYLERSPR
jgi:uncharacterized protein